MHNKHQSQTNSKTNVPGCSNPDLHETSAKMKAIEKAIKRYVKGGGNEHAGRALLASDMRRFAVKNLPSALVYGGFATPQAAERLAFALMSN